MTFARRTTTLAAGTTLTLGLSLVAFHACAQQGGFDPQGMAEEALATPFVGITTDGTPEDGLYRIESTGVSTAPVVDAANAFIAALDEDQRARVQFQVDADAWRNWANIHSFPREGVSLAAMDEAQREAAYGLLRASLSAKGYETSRDIMRLNHHLAELVSDFEDYGEHLYWLAIMGTPSATEPWGWQIEGHHLIVNYFVLGDQIVMTPTFMGSEPVTATSGDYAGVAILEAEQAAALDLMQALTPAQRDQAILGEKEGRSENQTEMFKDNVVMPYAGLPAADMDDTQRTLLLDLIMLYVGNMDGGHAAVKMTEVLAHLDETYIAWIGGTDAEAAFYYRIHSPVILIEFDHQGPIALGGPRNVPTRDHIHTVVRTPNGNDYGADLLQQHYDAHADDPDHGHGGE